MWKMVKGEKRCGRVEGLREGEIRVVGCKSGVRRGEGRAERGERQRGRGEREDPEGEKCGKSQKMLERVRR